MKRHELTYINKCIRRIKVQRKCQKLKKEMLNKTKKKKRMERTQEEYITYLNKILVDNNNRICRFVFFSQSQTTNIHIQFSNFET